MAMNDTLGSALSAINNCEKSGKKELVIISSKLVAQVLTIMHEHNYIGEFEPLPYNKLKVRLLGNINKCNVIKPRYPFKKDTMEKFEKRYLPSKGFGLIIVSTSKGVTTLNKCRELSMGGKLLSYVY